MYKDKWFAYLREKFSMQTPVLTPANNPDPVCTNCWDKGYASVIETVGRGRDFPGDTPGRGTRQVKKFCRCARGRQMEITDAYERGFQAGATGTGEAGND